MEASSLDSGTFLFYCILYQEFIAGVYKKQESDFSHITGITHHMQSNLYPHCSSQIIHSSLTVDSLTGEKIFLSLH